MSLLDGEGFCQLAEARRIAPFNQAAGDAAAQNLARKEPSAFNDGGLSGSFWAMQG
ncbi:hypothetical protein [Pseudomonas caspiana]|uniref:hypothetical protein n=1 Tax=Pseudomonas caspiana TaxID=1451454 RepID=UPI001EE6FB00|nr:hypothetical protein [Pseudomonas caspiana]